MAVVKGGAIGPRGTDGGVGGVAATPPAVGGVQEDAFSCILHHARLDLLHHLHTAKVTDVASMTSHSQHSYSEMASFQQFVLTGC